MDVILSAPVKNRRHALVTMYAPVSLKEYVTVMMYAPVSLKEYVTMNHMDGMIIAVKAMLCVTVMM